MNYCKNKNISKKIGPYTLISIPYKKVIQLEDELSEIWGILPDKCCSVEELFDSFPISKSKDKIEKIHQALELFIEKGLIKNE